MQNNWQILHYYYNTITQKEGVHHMWNLLLGQTFTSVNVLVITLKLKITNEY